MSPVAISDRHNNSGVQTKIQNRRNLPCYYPDKKVKVTTNQTNRFPPAFFLDYDLFSASSSKLPPASLEVPSYVSAEIGDYMQQHTIASQYFATIHLWMPIVSNPRCFNTLLNPLSFDRADVALLCLAMKLNLWLPTASSSDPHTTTYIAARQFLYGLEISGTLSLPILQAAILITIYEIGHAIYPAAYASISVCIQYAAALGLEWKTTSWRDGDQDWIESEERRRVWWAIVILERGLALLHVPWLYPANESMATKYRSALAWDAMDQLSDRFLNYSKKILSGTELPILESSPLSLHWSYQALVHFCRPSNKNTPSNRLQAQETIQEALKFAYSRWKLTETYLDMLTMNQYRNIQTI
ncbi:hypothetical protein THAR02_08765 [Trichoderma harzianum]|uniref:Xylanolytic transcriptional activator regulatory domain-containing protein n=1 Tax=Trichoderma harzianum TaxID=5544 RepID=A0A0F9ZFK9_TRIHA|nr:hypothetical protein THAR02_08765 [Trichoderma harzianum]